MKTFTPSEIATFCDVHQRTVSRWLKDGRLTGFKLPGRGNYRVTEQALRDFMNTQSIPLPPSLARVRSALVVDDEPQIRRAFSRVLTRMGLAVVEAEDGFQAGVSLMVERPEIMLLDLSMPRLDGFQVLRTVRERGELPNLKILVLSGLGDDELNRAVVAGADAALAKPVSNQALQDAVSELLGEF